MFKLTALLLLIQLCFPNAIFSEKRYFTRDPFNPNPIDVINKTQTFSEKSFKVMGIIWDKESPSVVIQFPRFKKIFYVGDTVNSFKITAITKKYIEIATPKEKIMVKLGEEKIFE
ncbi:hypothetical protein CL657_03310 [bacterium]|nr:hypothetical protein [bacterium]|tara:strand:+ start:196 stop:540 length:345 start_codon:yes stop_codon:yes gene_type:complete